MAPKIFVTGATGYIGGTALDLIINTHPDYEVTALCRSETKASGLKKVYPNIKTVFGDLDSTDMLKSETAKADIVLHFADCDHVASATSIAEGMISSSLRPHFLIHTSGTGILPDIKKPELYGGAPQPSERYNDVQTLDKVTSFNPESHIHRDVDSIVLGTPSHVQTAIVCPPTIYGPGLGAGNLRSNQIPNLAKHTLERGKAFAYGEGKNSWNNVHVRDLAKVYLALTEAAAVGGKGANWNEEGYYFVENGEHVWGEISELLAKKAKAKGYLKTDTVDHLSGEEIERIKPFGSILWGSNSIGKAERVRKVLGWTPTEQSLESILDDVIETEAKGLGLKE